MRQGSGFRWACLAAQFFFGGWFLAHGANHWLQFFPRPTGSSPIAHELIGALNHSGIFLVVKGLEVITGLMMLANRGVPLAATLAMPVTLSIAMLNILGNGDAFSLFVGVIIIALNSLILIGHLDRFLPMLVWRHEGPSTRGLRELAAEGCPSGGEPALRGLPHILAIVLGIAAPVLVTFWSVSDGGYRSQEHYRQIEEQHP